MKNKKRAARIQIHTIFERKCHPCEHYERDRKINGECLVCPYYLTIRKLGELLEQNN